MLYTGHDNSYAALAAITVPRMQSYALKHDMDFMCFTEPLIDVPNGIYWTGVCGALQAFEKGYDRVIYLDVDQLITNFDKSSRQLCDCVYGFHASKDWGIDAMFPWNFSMCGFIAHKDTGDSIFKLALSAEPEWRDKPFPEQGPMQHVVRTIMIQADMEKVKYRGAIIHPRKVFNCVPDQVCPGKVPEPWTPGDFAAHITMVSLERRIEIAKEILSQL